MQELVYEFAAIPLESDDIMATQLERIAALENTASIAKWVLGIFIPLVIGWGAFITVNVIAMKQSLTDSGNTKLVAELKSPKSPEQLQANLTTVTAQIQTARVEGRKPDEKKVTALSGALSQVVQRNPDIPEAWQAVSQLISYRSRTQSPVENIGNCMEKPFKLSPEFQNPPENFPGTTIYMSNFHDCTLILDNLDLFYASPMWRDFQDVAKLHPPHGGNLALALSLKNVNVVYRGGQLPPVLLFIFEHCDFDWNIEREVPPDKGKRLTSELLTANLSEENIQFSAGL